MIQTHLILFFIKLESINREANILILVVPYNSKFVKNIFCKSFINIFEDEHVTLSRKELVNIG